MTFETSKRLDNWCKRHQENGCVSHATAGEQFVYKFLPSGIVECRLLNVFAVAKNSQIM